MFAIKVKQLTLTYQLPKLPSVIASALLVLSMSGISNSVHAVFIDFDDITALPAEPFDGCLCGHVLSDEYESQGLIFNGDSSWLIGGVLPDGTNRNGVQGFNGISLSFVGTLPNFISFNAFSVNEDAIFIAVYGENDYLFTHVGSGWQGTEETSTPYIPGELISFTATEGIKSLHISSLFSLRTGPYIDNLTFESRSVPEPAPFVLFSLALAGLFWRRIGRQPVTR